MEKAKECILIEKVVNILAIQIVKHGQIVSECTIVLRDKEYADIVFAAINKESFTSDFVYDSLFLVCHITFNRSTMSGRECAFLTQRIDPDIQMLYILLNKVIELFIIASYNHANWWHAMLVFSLFLDKIIND